MSRLAKIQDDLAQHALRMEATRAITGDADVIAARDLELESQVTEAAKLQKQYAFEKAVADSAESLRKTVAGCVPAPAAAPALDIRPLPFAQKVRYFDTHENAYRAGRFIQAKFLGNVEARQWCHEHNVEARAVVESVNSSGGFTMVDEFSTNLIRLVEQYGVASRVLQREVMGTDTKLVPKRLTGTTAYWVGENTEITTSDPTGTMVQLVAKKMGVGTKVSNEVLNDSNAVNVSEWLLQEFATSISYLQDNSAFNGDGSSSYGGIYGIVQKLGNSSYAGSVATAAAGHTGASTLTLADYESALAKLPRYVFERGNPSWYVHHAVYHSSMQVLGLTAGGNSIDTINSSAGIQYRFLGLPVVPVVVMDSVVSADAGKIKALVGDMGLSSILGMRQEFSLRMTTERYIELDIAAWYGTGRMDIVHHTLGDTTNPGPVVALKTAAS